MVRFSESRLVRHGADLVRVSVNAATRGDERTWSSLAYRFHEGDMERIITANGIDLLVMDPIDWFVELVRATRRHKPMATMAALIRLAETHNLALVGVVGTGRRAAHAGQHPPGASAIASFARSIITIADAPRTPNWRTPRLAAGARWFR